MEHGFRERRLGDIRCGYGFEGPLWAVLWRIDRSTWALRVMRFVLKQWRGERHWGLLKLLGFSSITVEGDSQQLVKVLNKEIQCPAGVEVIVCGRHQTV